MRVEKTNLVFISISVSVVAWLIAVSYYPAPQQLVSNQTFEKYSNPFFTYEITKYPSNVEIILPQYQEKKTTIGIVTDPWNLNFGIIPLGGYGTRHLTISNFEKDRVRVILNSYGSIKPLVRFSKNNFILNPGETVYVDIYLNTTLNKTGNYSGEIDVVIKKSNFDFLYLFL